MQCKKFFMLPYCKRLKFPKRIRIFTFSSCFDMNALCMQRASSQTSVSELPQGRKGKKQRLQHKELLTPPEVRRLAPVHMQCEKFFMLPYCNGQILQHSNAGYHTVPAGTGGTRRYRVVLAGPNWFPAGTRWGPTTNPPCMFQCLLSDSGYFLNMLQIMLAIGEIH